MLILVVALQKSSEGASNRAPLSLLQCTSSQNQLDILTGPVSYDRSLCIVQVATLKEVALNIIDQSFHDF